MKVAETHIVPAQSKPIRLSDYAGGIFQTIPSRKGMKKAIQKKLVAVNGNIATTGTFLSGGEEIILYEAATERPIYKKTLEVLWEDEYLAAINKPAGILVNGNAFKTIENALLFNLKQSEVIDALTRPQAAHRLDFPTTGVLLIGKTRTALSTLKKMFEEKAIEKTYLAVTIGEMEEQKGTIDLPIDDKASCTTYVVLEQKNSPKYGQINLVQLYPMTGRRHQIRKHLAAIGTPILGDKNYAQYFSDFKGTPLYLHAYTLQFKHPITEKLVEVTQKAPKKFHRIFEF